MLYLAPSVQHIAQLGIVEFTNTELKELKSYACHSCLCAVQNKIQPLNSKTPLEHNSARPVKPGVKLSLDLRDYGFEDIGGFKYALVSIMPGQQKEKDSKKKKKVCRTSDSNRESSD